MVNGQWSIVKTAASKYRKQLQALNYKLQANTGVKLTCQLVNSPLSPSSTLSPFQLPVNSPTYIYTYTNLNNLTKPNVSVDKKSVINTPVFWRS
jgi:hypothetical protein